MSRSASLFRRLSMALVFVFLYAPILVLIVFSFNDYNLLDLHLIHVRLDQIIGAHLSMFGQPLLLSEDSEVQQSFLLYNEYSLVHFAFL